LSENQLADSNVGRFLAMVSDALDSNFFRFGLFNWTGGLFDIMALSRNFFDFFPTDD
jgi:hypothetical protein